MERTFAYALHIIGGNKTKRKMRYLIYIKSGYLTISAENSNIPDNELLMPIAHSLPTPCSTTAK
jgi:hypothetical protein